MFWSWLKTSLSIVFLLKEWDVHVFIFLIQRRPNIPINSFRSSPGLRTWNSMLGYAHAQPLKICKKTFSETKNATESLIVNKIVCLRKVETSKKSFDIILEAWTRGGYWTLNTTACWRSQNCQHTFDFHDINIRHQYAASEKNTIQFEFVTANTITLILLLYIDFNVCTSQSMKAR